MKTSGETRDGDGLLFFFRQLTEDLPIALADDEEIKEPDIKLADGMPLPKYLRESFPELLFGKPIHEIDPFYTNKNTFVVISTNWVIHRFSSLKSLWLLTPLNRIRWFCIRTITHCVFRIFMILVVIFYSFFYFLIHSFDFQLPFLTIFALEMNVKIIAYGLVFHPFSYLRNPWNWIDFILTQIGLTLGMIASYLRPIHSLRSLRLIQFFTYSRLTYSWVFRSLCRMRDLMIFGAFIFFIFTIYSQIHFLGHLKNACVKQNSTTRWAQVHETFSVCGNTSGSRVCPDGYSCMADAAWNNPNHGYTSFDNFYLAGLSVVRLMAKDYWDNLFMLVQGAIGPSQLPFFLTVIVYGGYYFTNLVVAHLAVGITELLQILEGKKTALKRKKVNSDNGHLASDDNKAASEKEKASIEIDEKTSSQVIDVPLIDEENQEKEEDEGDVIVLEPVNINGQGEEKQDEEKDESINRKPHRRNPITSLCMAFVDAFCDWNCCLCWVKFQKLLGVVVLNRYFDLFILFCIISNTVILAFDHHNMPYNLYIALDLANMIFLLIYFIEAVLKILTLSPKHYFKDTMNVLDFFIVFFAILELLLANVAGLSLFRLFRIFRILRLSKWWHHLKHLFEINKTNGVALFTIVITFAIMGTHMFSNQYLDAAVHGFVPRWNFLDLSHSLLLVIRIICGEWIEPLWDCLLVSGAWLCVPYFFSIIIIGNLVLFTLFITMVMVGLNSHDLCETELDEEHTFLFIIKDCFRSICPSIFCCSNQLGEKISGKSQEELFDVSIEGEARSSHEEKCTTTVEDAVAPCWCNACYKWMPWCGSPSKGPSSATAVTADHTPFWSKWENLRIKALSLVRSKYFDTAMIIFIILTYIPQLWDDAYLIPYSASHIIIMVANYLVMFVYTFEILLQVMGHGCKKYFTNGWYGFDFQITLMHFGALLFDLMPIAVGFRPLKLISRVKRFRAVISAVLYKLAGVFDVLVASAIIWLVFAIVGVQMFGGRYYSCVDADLNPLPIYEADSKTHCILSNSTWINANNNFDHVGNAVIALIHVATLKGWVSILHNAMDVRAIDLQPSHESNIHMSWFFVIFLFFGVLCCLALILAAFVRRVNDHRKKAGGYIQILMTDIQKQTFTSKKGNFFIAPVKVCPCPTWWLRRFVYRLVVSSQFKLAIILVTSFNAVGLAVLSLEIEERVFYALTYIDVAFFLVFIIEIALRITAFGRNFFKRPWNVFDFVILILSIITYTVHPFFPGFVIWPAKFGIFRTFRLIRWFRWVRRIASRIFIYAPALNNLGLLLLVINCTYTFVGMELFRHVPIVLGVNDLQNFVAFIPAITTVTMLGFGSGWDNVIEMFEGSRLFVMSYLLIFYLIVIEAGTIILLENYYYLNEKRRLGFTDANLENYESAWKILDPDATGYISYDHLSEFLHALLPPFQIPHPNFDQIAALDIPVYKDNNVAFNDVLLTLLSELDSEGKIVRPSVSNPGDVISSTSKMQPGTSAASTEPEVTENEI